MQRTKWSWDASRRESSERSWSRNAEATVLELVDFELDPFVAASATSLSSRSAEKRDSSARASAETTSLFFERKPLVEYDTVPAAWATEKEDPAPAGHPKMTEHEEEEEEEKEEEDLAAKAFAVDGVDAAEEAAEEEEEELPPAASTSETRRPKPLSEPPGTRQASSSRAKSPTENREEEEDEEGATLPAFPGRASRAARVSSLLLQSTREKSTPSPS